MGGVCYVCTRVWYSGAVNEATLTSTHATTRTTPRCMKAAPLDTAMSLVVLFSSVPTFTLSHNLTVQGSEQIELSVLCPGGICSS